MKERMKDRVTTGLLFIAGAVMFAIMLILFTYCMPAGAAAEIPTVERVLNLPADEGKWHVSVVGVPGEQRYVNLLAWFESNSTLKELKAGVHFHKIDSTSAAYGTRYKKSIRALPTVRVQKPDGFVVYESSGNNVPESSEGLSYDIAGASNMAGWQILRRPIFDGRLFPIFNRPFLPWRQRMMNRKQNDCPDGNCPQPQPTPNIDVDIVIPGPAQPELEPAPRGGLPAQAVIGLCIACFVAGALAGLVTAWKKTGDN